MGSDRGVGGAQAGGGWRSWVGRHPVLCFCIVSALWIGILYHGVLGAPFVYDDLDQIANNTALESWQAVWTKYLLRPVKFNFSPLGDGGSTYRPVFWIALALEKHAFGNEPGWFHLTSLLLFWTNGVLLFVLLRRLKMSWPVAGLATLLWLGMPVNTEAVAWISGQLYPLSTAFLLAALLMGLGYVRSAECIRSAAFAGSALLANLCHEQGILLIALLALGCCLLEEDRRPRRWAILLALALLADAIYAACRWALSARPHDGPHHLLATGEVFWRYVQMVILPVRMSVERSTDVPRAAMIRGAIAAWVALVVLIMGTVQLRRRSPGLAATLGFVLVAILPYCGFVFIYQGMAERYVYLASIGFAVGAVAVSAAARTSKRRIALACVAVWATWGAWRLMVRVDDWRDPVALYGHSLEATPGSVTMILNYAAALQLAGRLGEAESQYRRLIPLAPKNDAIYVDLESLYIDEGRLNDAIAMYKQAIALDPNNAMAYFDLGVMFQSHGQPEYAAVFYKKVLKLKPGDLDALRCLEQLQRGTG